MRLSTFSLLGLLLLLAPALLLSGCDSDPFGCPNDGSIQTTDLTEGTGDTVAFDDTINVDYTLFLEDGSIAESAQDVEFPLSALIPAWQEGVPGMKEGGSRRIVAPPNTAYRSLGQGSVPPCETITFEITVNQIVTAP